MVRPFFRTWRERRGITMQMGELKKYGFPDEIIEIWKKSESDTLLDVQENAIDGGLFKDESMVIVAPASSGKTFVGEMASVKVAFDGKKAIYLIPLKAIAEEKFLAFLEKYKDYGIDVKLSSGDYRQFDTDIESGIFDIAIIVYEKMYQFLVRKPQILSDVGLVVVDEIQLLNERTRGPSLEMLLTKILISNPNVQLLCLSAVVGNAPELASWLKAQPIVLTKRPLELREGVYLDGTLKYREFNTGNEGEEQLIQIKSAIRHETVCQLAKYFIDNGEQVLIFLKNKPSTVKLAQSIANLVRLPPAGEALKELQGFENTLNARQLKETLRKGVAFHNADLLTEERQAVEKHFRKGEIKVVCATTTLAMGLNLPAKTVIFYDAKRWDGTKRRYFPLTVNEYKNMSGRAGRYKLQEDFGRSILIATRPFERDRLWRKYVAGSIGKIESRLKERAPEAHVLGLIASGMCKNESEIRDFLSQTFYSHSFGRDQTSREYISDTVKSIVKKILTYGLATLKNGSLKITALGKACAIEGISLDTCNRIHDYIGESRGEKFDDVKLLYAASSTEDSQYVYYYSRKDYTKYFEMLKKKLSILLKNDGEEEDGKRIIGHDIIDSYKTALCMKDWIEGVSYRELENKYDTPSGTIRRCAEGLSWVVHAVASVARVVNVEKEHFEEIYEISDRLVYGIPSKMLEIAELRVTGLGREHLRQLKNKGLVKLDDILDTTIDELQNIIPKHLAIRLHEKIRQRIEDTLRRQKVGHLLRMEKLGRKTDTIKGCYELDGKSFSRAAFKLLQDVGLNVEYLEEEKNHRPDILVHLREGSIVIQCTARIEKNYVGVKKAGEILSQGPRYNPIAYIVIGRPDFDTKAIQNASQIEKIQNYKMIPLNVLCEMVVRFYENKLSMNNVIDVLGTKRGYIQVDVLNNIITR